MHKFFGFTTFWTSFITLIQIASGENYNLMLNSLSKENSSIYQCIDDPNYEDFVAANYTP